ncbi:HNH endonuclease [Streptomyces stelliscabiei]|uniref:HNH endonuclease n=1 Tax=Streptomyces stelliscabiei TaxID=146820 RepID=UPI0029A48FF0|nr:HNH endonuclease [Streptomyces stelliscabiei]MDX2639920.1 HNH endonuclease [Streptomyces stelliscabiei]MDX2662834.1 HNH endonuclease [Streptomyces stelliscabiei]MDX2714500.1 HNH endonuclease [Streptomyces stelliscabiei]MDX2792237.1 HNH endonuclease [Streptomyces stelliscabiei]
MPKAPPTRCSAPECYDLATARGRCDSHQRQPWAGRDDKVARYGISSGAWRSLKARVDRRDNGHCYCCGGPAAEGETLELDHIVPVAEGGARTALENLGLIHAEPCHAEKSKREAQRGSQRRRARRPRG